uniref:Uncharacterized protein n=1 Tax=Strongyloides papillosus TaxID=174720 RepID=A0A0N5CFE5_STREA
MGLFLKAIFVFIFCSILLVYGAPTYDIKEQLAQVREQLNLIESQIKMEPEEENIPLIIPKSIKSGDKVRRQLAWQPMKRSLAWQPMRKRSIFNSDESRDEIINILENRLMEVLSIGERLGVSAGDVIDHLRKSQNTM